MKLKKLQTLAEAKSPQFADAAEFQAELEKLIKTVREAAKLATSKKMTNWLAATDKNFPGLDAKSTVTIIGYDLNRLAKKLENFEADLEANT